MMDEEKKYKEVISALKSLPKVKSKSDFEQKLYRKLRNAEDEKISSPAFEKLTRPKEKNWIFNIFKPSFVPAIGLTIALIAVIVIYINFIPGDEDITQNEQVPQNNEEMVIKDPGSTEKNYFGKKQDDNELITQDVTGGIVTDERSMMPVSPRTDVDEAPAPTNSRPEKLDAVPLMEQKIERKEADDKIIEKEGRIEKKSGDMKKGEKKESLKTNKSEEESNIKKNVGDEIFQNGLKPSMGLDKTKAKDSIKTDSIKSKKSKDEGSENGQIEQETETEKQAEPLKQEPNKEEK